MRKAILFIFLAFIQTATFAQSNYITDQIDKAMVSDRKIYVVVAVCLTILLGLVLYLVRLDRKISKLEKGK